MQVVLATGVSSRPNFMARSTTGTTAPRKLMTPLTHLGVFGTVVTVSYSMISFTLRMPMAYSSLARRKVRYCFCSTASLVAVVMACSLEPGKAEFALITRVFGFSIGLHNWCGMMQGPMLLRAWLDCICTGFV